MEDPTDHEHVEIEQEFNSERLGLHTRPLKHTAGGDHLADAIEHAITAGACRHAGRLNPDNAHVWHAVAEAHRRDAKAALQRWLAARDAGS